MSAADDGAMLPGLTPKTSTKTLLEILERHYIKPNAPMPGGVFLTECGVNGTFGASNRADALYVGFTSASGRLLIGHEVKVSRSDWRRELDQAGKADWWADNCHEWWIVAPGPEVVPVEELPEGWGLLYPSSRSRNRMQVVRQATRYPDRQPGWDAVRSIMARLDTLQRSALAAFAVAERDRHEQQVEDHVERRLAAAGAQALTPDQRSKLAAIERIEHLLGEPISNDWFAPERVTPAQAAAALRLVRAGHALNLPVRGHDSDSIRQAAERVIAGLGDFELARTELLAIVGEQY